MGIWSPSEVASSAWHHTKAGSCRSAHSISPSITQSPPPSNLLSLNFKGRWKDFEELRASCVPGQAASIKEQVSPVIIVGARVLALQWYACPIILTCSFREGLKKHLQSKSPIHPKPLLIANRARGPTADECSSPCRAARLTAPGSFFPPLWVGFYSAVAGQPLAVGSCLLNGSHLSSMLKHPRPSLLPRQQAEAAMGAHSP